MKKIIKYTAVISVLLLAYSCDGWLDVTPPSQVPEDQQFDDEVGFRQALVGCYIGMAQENLYGKNLTWYAADIQSGQYDLHTNMFLYGFSTYKYKLERSMDILDDVWQSAYGVIANANNALKFIDEKRDVLHPISYKTIKGELLAIRAMLHFDILRYYGYGNLRDRQDKDTKLTIPYITEYKKEMTSQRTYKETIELILSDLKSALTFLDEDPVLKVHDDDFYEQLNDDGFYSNRTYRLNYFAVKALMARVYMWEGSNASIVLARQEAMDVINKGETAELYTWINNASSQNDPVHSTEHIASLNITSFTDKVSSYFPLNFEEGTQYNVIKLSDTHLSNIFHDRGEDNSDYRFNRMFYQASNGYYIPQKMSQDRSIKNRVPLIRIPELYLIVAESYLKGGDINRTEGVKYLKELRERRANFASLDGLSVENLLDCISDEYRKEFLCEGIIFLYYKRIGAINIPNSIIVMDDATYTWPYPETETAMGRVQ